MRRRALKAAVAAVGVSLLVGGTAMAQGWPGPGPGMGRRDHHGRWWMPVVVGLVVLALAALVWVLLRRRSAPGAAPALASPTAGAEAILAERLARSEVSPEEYHRLLATLRGVPLADADAPVGNAGVVPAPRQNP